MAKKRYSHKEILRSMKRDELRDGLTGLQKYVREHSENILIAAIIIGVVAILVPMYFRHRATNEMRAASLLARANSLLERPLTDEQTALTGQGFVSREAKYQKVRETFAEVHQTYSNTRAADLAKLGEANALYYLGRYEEALAIYREAVEAFSADVVTASVRERLGATLENLERWQEALETYQSLLASHPDYFHAPSVRLGIARCHEALGEIEVAREILERELEADGFEGWTEAARRQLALLEKRHP